MQPRRHHRSHRVVAGCLIAAAAFLSVNSARAAGTAPRISGFVDTTYNYNFQRPLSRITANRSFDRKTDAFLLNAAQLNLDGGFKGNGKDIGDVDYHVELAYGTDPSVYKAAGTGIDAGLPAAPSNLAYNFELQEAFLTYRCPITSAQLKVGKFVTQHGIEVIESGENFTITRGFLFGMAEPFTHTGALAGYQFPKYVDVWAGVVNGWDLHTDNNSGKTLLAKVGLTFGEKLVGSISFLRGAEKLNNTNDARTSVDTTWFVKPVKKLTVGLQFLMGEEENSSIAAHNRGGAAHWYGATLQPKFDFTKKYFIGGRYEWLSDIDGNRSGAGQVVQNFTLAPGINLTDNLMFRTEYRHDWSSSLVYTNDAGVVDKKDADTVALEFLLKFGS